MALPTRGALPGAQVFGLKVEVVLAKVWAPLGLAGVVEVVGRGAECALFSFFFGEVIPSDTDRSTRRESLARIECVLRM